MMIDRFEPLKPNGAGSAEEPEPDWRALLPAPPCAPPPASHRTLGKPAHVWDYRDARGALLGRVYRFEPPRGKVILPLTFCEGPGGAREWRWKACEKPRPLYGLDALALHPEAFVVVCEGEKSVEAARRLCPSRVVVTSPGGANSAAKANWSPIAERHIVIWPDADSPGAKYAQEVVRQALAAGAASVAIVSPPSGVKEGWDAADAEDEGWTPARVDELLHSAAPVSARHHRSRSGERKTGGKARRIPQRDQLTALLDGVVLWSAPDDEVFATYEVKGCRQNWPIRSKQFRRWFSNRAYREMGSVVGSQALEDALKIFEAMANEDGEIHDPWLRVGARDGKLYIDLANANYECVEIGPNSWTVRPIGDLPFVRSKTMRSLPYPEAGYGIETLRGYINCSDSDFVLYVSWIVAAMRPTGPYPILVVNGRQGTGKTVASKLARAFIDPAKAPLRAAPKDVRDLVVTTSNCHVLGFDNFSQVPAWLSDIFCSLATGGGFSTRELHSDKEETVFEATRPILFNGIGSLAERGDLAERAIVINLKEISETGRMTEEEMKASLDRDSPLIFGALLTGLSAGLRKQSDIILPRKPRMADFAKWGAACESGLGWEPNSFLSIYMENQKDAGDAAFEADAVAVAIKKLMGDLERLASRPPQEWLPGQDGSAWTGTATELLSLLTERFSETVRKSKAWPYTASGLGNRIERAAPVLKTKGVSVTKKHSGDRTITLAKIERSPDLDSAARSPSYGD